MSKRLVFTSIVSIALYICAGRSGSAQASLRDILSNENCHIACFLGIEPGTTSQAELENILDDLGASYEVEEIGVSGFLLAYDVIYPSSFPQIEATFSIFATKDHNVEEVILRLRNVAVDNVLEAYGAPAKITGVVANENYNLVYPTQGLIFSISQETPQSVQLVIMRTQTSVEYYMGFIDLQPCTEPLLLCSIEIPSYAPESTPELTSVSQLTLRDALLDENCASSCFMGIQPEITSESELEIILDDAGIQYIASTLGLEGNYFTYQFNPNSPVPSIVNDAKSAAVLTANNRVTMILLSLHNTSVADILEEFDVPEIVNQDGSCNLVYPSLGLTFSISREEPYEVIRVDIRSE
jgi:hypothetical protein